MVGNNHRRPTQKQIILEVYESRGFEKAAAAEIRALQQELRRRLGDRFRPSPSYIAAVLRAAGKRVEYNDRFLDPAMDDHHAGRLKGLLHFHDFESTEDSIRKLDTVYREYREAMDRIGTSLARTLALKGKLRAESLAANPRVNPEKRKEKREIANWFRVWLEIPDLFFDWLELRKQSEEFQRMFPAARPPQPASTVKTP